MPSVSESVTIPFPPSAVWPLLRDPALVASCIPGAELSPDSGDGIWRGTVNVKFGPTRVAFKGEAELAYDDAAQRCTITGRGIDGRGSSNAQASGAVSVSGEETTALTVDGEFYVSGPLEAFANAGGVFVARALLSEFANNLAKVIAERSTPQGEAAPPPSDKPEAKSISAIGLSKAAIKNWWNGGQS